MEDLDKTSKVTFASSVKPSKITSQTNLKYRYSPFGDLNLIGEVQEQTIEKLHQLELKVN